MNVFAWFQRRFAPRYSITPTVRQQIEHLFPAAEVASVLAALETSNLSLLPTTTATVERIHLAILHLSGGSVPRFESLLGAAEQDWRDVLVGAGLGNADWPHVLRSRGLIPSLRD